MRVVFPSSDGFEERRGDLGQLRHAIRVLHQIHFQPDFREHRIADLLLHFGRQPGHERAHHHADGNLAKPNQQHAHADHITQQAQTAHHFAPRLVGTDFFPDGANLRDARVIENSKIVGGDFPVGLRGVAKMNPLVFARTGPDFETGEWDRQRGGVGLEMEIPEVNDDSARRRFVAEARMEGVRLKTVTRVAQATSFYQTAGNSPRKSPVS